MQAESNNIRFLVRREELEFILRFSERALYLSNMNVGINPLKDEDENKVKDLIKRIKTALGKALDD